MPMAGNGPMPKMSSGSRIMLPTQPTMRATMVTFIRPTDWKIFSKAREAMLTVAKPNTM